MLVSDLEFSISRMIKMKILIVGLVKNEHLLRLREEGEKRGHTIDGCYATELAIETSIDGFKPSLRGKSLEKYDLIAIWTVGKRRWEWYVACYYLAHEKGVKIVNYKVVDPDYKLYLSPSMNYYKQSKEKLPFPKTSVIFYTASIDTVIGGFDFPVIVKASGGRQGRGIYKVENREDLDKLVAELQEEKLPIFIREFIPNDGDIRVFTVGYKVIGAMKRTPTAEGEFRSNISQGGEGSEFPIDEYPEVRKIAERMSELTKTEVAGVDIMLDMDTGKPYILEINPAPQFMGLEKYTSTNAAEEIIVYFETLR